MRKRSRIPLEDLESRVDRVVSENGDMAQVEVIGSSLRGRPLRAVHVARESGEEDRERVLIISGHHGMEDGGPRTVVRLLEWLVTDEAESIREPLSVTVVPCVNPDGYERDEPFNSAGINLDKDYAPPSQPESKAVWALAERLAPELAIDMHTFGGGCSSELLVSYPHGLSHYDRWVHFLMADRVNLAAEKAGFPQWPTLRLDPKSQNDLIASEGHAVTFPDRCHEQFGSLAFYIEMNDTIYTPEETTASGLVRLKEFLQIGTERFWGEGEAGYPVRIPTSSPPNAVAVCGRNAAERRACRLDLWPVRHSLYADTLWPEHLGRYQVTFRHSVPYWKPKHGIALRARFSARFSPVRVQINGDSAPTGTDRLNQWTDDAAHVIEFARPECWYGGFTMTVEYERAE